MLLIASITAAAPCRAAEITYRIWEWRFGTVSGHPGARAPLARAGVRHLALSPDGIADPFDEDCVAGVNHDGIRPCDRAAAARHFRCHWHLPAALDTPGTVARWGWCKGMHVAAVALIRPGFGYRFLEDEIIIELR